METEKSFKEKWKSELDSSLFLSAKVKEKLIEKVTSHQVEEKTGAKWIYPMVLYAFVFGAVFFLYITVQNNPIAYIITSNKSISTNFKLSDLILTEKYYWMFVAILLEAMTVRLFFEVIKKTKRWQTNEFIIRITGLLTSWPSNLAIQGFCSILIGGAIVFASLSTIKILTVCFVLLVNCLILLWFVRNLYKATCPHCEQCFTRKELFKMTWAPNRLKCIHCGGDIYLSKKTMKNSIHYTWAPFISHYVLGFFGIPFPILGFSFILVGLFFNFYIVTFTYSFSKEDEPLW